MSMLTRRVGRIPLFIRVRPIFFAVRAGSGRVSRVDLEAYFSGAEGTFQWVEDIFSRGGQEEWQEFIKKDLLL